jgi:XRE family aerobic/anaerobic benzoate catabolism transcriptional regulator
MQTRSRRTTPRRDPPAVARALTALLARVGERVRATRQARGLTLAQLATSASLSRRFLTDVELGKANVSLQGLVKICGALGLEPAELLAQSNGAPRATPASAARAATPRRFALVGLRGAGKTTLGRRLAERVKLPFVELDQLVEEAAGMPLADVFTLHGDAWYRQVERETLKKLIDERRPMVLAAGGGIVAAPDTYELLRRHFVTIWLKASPDEHWNRVVEQGDQRPMQGQPRAMGRLREILADRAPLYGLAQHVVDTTALGESGSAARLEEIVRDAGGGERERAGRGNGTR